MSGAAPPPGPPPCPPCACSCPSWRPSPQRPWGGLLFSFLTITLRANQNVTGLTLTIFGGGVANFFGGSLNSMAGGVGQISVAATSAAYRANIANQADLGSSAPWSSATASWPYLAILVAIVLWYFLTAPERG